MATCPTCNRAIGSSDGVCPFCGAELPGTGAPDREYKVVTTVYCDVVGSTALGSRLGAVVTSRLMDEYGETVRRVLGERGGATVSKRHGDGFMATFGVPELHEDDALRAVQAASALRAAVGEISSRLQGEHGIGLEVRVGINTGDVLVVHDASTHEEELVGSAVNLTKRFEEAAGPGEILLGDQTYQLVADAVNAEPTEPVPVKGLPGPPLPCWRFLDVLPRPKDREPAPLVGRTLELELLTRLFDRAVVEQRPHLVSVLGPSGVGKSRLSDEFALGLGERATVLRTKCPEIATNVTVWPLIEIIRQAAGIRAKDPPEVAKARLADVVREEERGALVTERMAQMLGFGGATGLPEGTLWALQRLLAAVARRRPLVVVVDDVQWAAAILLDAVEHLASNLQDIPVLLLSIARPDELALNHAGWPRARPNTFLIDLTPLRVREGEQLVRNLLKKPVDPDLQALITQEAQGYPLMIVERVASLRHDGLLADVGGEWVLQSKATDGGGPQTGSVPAKIRMLYLSRLERLSPRGRTIVEAASVVGERFHVGDVQALTRMSRPLDVGALQELVDLGQVLLDHSPESFPLPADSGTGYKFCHPMIRTVAYGRIPDDRRAELHERYADWLTERTGDRPIQFDELIANHLSEAHRYRRKLAPRDERTLVVAQKAGERYANAGRRAAERGDTRLVQEWLGPAIQLLPRDHSLRREVLPSLAEAQQASGKLEEAARSYEELAKSATAVGDEKLAMHATIGRLRLLALHEPQRFKDQDRDQIELAIPVFERLGDKQGLAMALHLLAYLHWTRGRLSLAANSADVALRNAREAGDAYWEAAIIGLLSLVLYWGSTPLDDVERRNREWLAEAQRRSMRSLEATALTVLARVAALKRDTDEARQFVRSANSITADLGESLTQAADCITQALIEVIDDDLDTAESLLRSGYRQLEEMGGTRPRASVAAMLARVVYLRGRSDEAEELTQLCERIAPPDQLDVQIKWRSVRGVTLARSEPEKAEGLAKEAVGLADKTDQVDSQAEARIDLAEVLRLNGRRREAMRELERAIDLYRAKGNVVGEGNASRLLRALEG